MLKIIKIIIIIFLGEIFFLTTHALAENLEQSVYQTSKKWNNWECTGIFLADVYVPGLGYIIAEDYSKAVSTGIPRWILRNKALQALQTDGFQEKVPHEERGDDIYIAINKETWDYQFNATIYSNLVYFVGWDFYEHSCQPNTDAYSALYAPVNFSHFYDKWQFWLPLGVLSLSFFNTERNTNYQLGNGLTKRQLYEESFPLYYSVGIGEETLFRGILQKQFFQWYQKINYDLNTSRHLAVLSASTLFGLAHAGQGFQANSATAFLYGVYLGYVYQPSIYEYDLTTAIALHSWWDILVVYSIYKNSNFTEEEGSVNQVTFPLITVGFTF